MFRLCHSCCRDAFVSLIDRISAACFQGCIELQSLVLCNNYKDNVSACMLVFMLSGLFQIVHRLRMLHFTQADFPWFTASVRSFMQLKHCTLKGSSRLC